MIRLNEKVTHDGKTYDPGEEIEKINKNQAQRLVDLGVAFFVGQKQYSLPPDDVNENAAEELDTIDYRDLKEMAKDIGLDFPGNVSKKNLIDLIIEEEKADKILELTEVEE